MLAIAPTDRIFILAGAGVSAESGIPTFRGVGDSGATTGSRR
jgi:NAD-dependent SIR2 family protein deacetylase